MEKGEFTFQITGFGLIFLAIFIVNTLYPSDIDILDDFRLSNESGQEIVLEAGEKLIPYPQFPWIEKKEYAFTKGGKRQKETIILSKETVSKLKERQNRKIKRQEEEFEQKKKCDEKKRTFHH